MLNAVEDRAKEHGWLVISETASPGFIDRITRQQLPRLLRDFDPDAVHLPGIYTTRLVLNAHPEKRIEKRTITEKAGA